MVDTVNERSSESGSETGEFFQLPGLSLFYPSLADHFHKKAKMIWDSGKTKNIADEQSTSSDEENLQSTQKFTSHRVKKSKKVNDDLPLKIGGHSSDSDSEDSDDDRGKVLLQSVKIEISQEISCTEIRPRNVRWFYKSPEGKKWISFTGYDSIRIELKYRHLQCENEETWQEVLKLTDETERSEFNSSEEKVVVQGGLYEVDVIARTCTSIFWTGDSSSIMRGVWFYEGSFQPIEEPYVSEIESEHINRFKGYHPPVEDNQPSSPRKTITQAIHDIRFSEFHVEWYTPNQIYLYSEAKSSKIMRSVTEKLGFQKSGYKLSRGYKVEATLDDKPSDITHLVFVIHGVGQKTDSRRIIRNCGSLRNCANWLKEKYFSYLTDLKERSEFFPVEWRSSLKLDGDTVDSITLHRVRGLREFLNSNAMDIMYYTSPLYRMELINGLQVELCRLYKLFCERNPNFEKRNGKVSIVAHSLGCVITYDLLTGWNPPHFNETQLEQLDNARLNKESVMEDRAKLLMDLNTARNEVHRLEKALQEFDIKDQLSGKTKLPFTIENFFCLGSPLGVFLALRGIRPKGTGLIEDIMPSTIAKRFFNICHPSDPVAYRLEPLVLKHYSAYMPLVVHYYNSSEKTPYEDLKPESMTVYNQDKRPQSPTTAEDCDSTNDSPSKSVKGESRWSMMAWPTWTRRKEQNVTEMKEIKSDDNEIEEPGSPYFSSDGEEISLQSKKINQSSTVRATSPTNHVLNNGSVSPNEPEPTCLEYRLDYMLREGNLENSYISAFTSHTSYWTSYDAASFILSYLHSPDARKSPDLP